MEKDARTLFVRGVSFEIDEKPLEEVFSEVGPVKSCFLVREKGAPKHKGFGFVQFALQEDAERAAAELNGKSVGGRKLLVEVANKRAPLEERKRKRREQGEAKEEGAGQGEEGAAPAEPGQAKAKEEPAAANKQTKGPKGAKGAAAGEPAAAAAQPKQAGRPQQQQAGKPAAAAAGAAAAARPKGAGQASPKHRLMHAVALGNLTPATTQQAIQLAKRAGKVEEVLNPAPADMMDRAKVKADGCTGAMVVVFYETVQEAMQAVCKLHGAKLGAGAGGAAGGKKGGKKGGKQEEGADGKEGAEEPPVVLWARQVSGEGAHVRKWRVILRNLHFQANEKHLRAALAPAGFVWELTIPRGPDGRVKGFAFAAFTARAHAVKAIELVNGKEILGREVAVDWAVAKAQYEASARGRSPSPAPEGPPGEEGAGKGNEDEDEEMEGEDGDMDSEEEDEEGDEDEEDEDEEGEEGDEEGEEDEEFAQEHKMLKGVLKGVLSQADDDQEEGGKKGKDKEGAKVKAQAADKKQGGKKQQQQEEEEEDEEDEEEEAEEEEAEDEEGKGRQQPGASTAKAKEAGAKAEASKGPRDWTQHNLARTVFVRGLPVDITQITLQAKMEAYGRVHMCRLVLDKATGKPKGTAFIEFKEEAGAKKASDACARGRAGKGPGVVLGGRPLDVDLAVDKDNARQIAVEKAGGPAGGKDKRNMYLAKEGDVPRNSPAWMSMSEHDRDKRERAAEEKRTKLKSPNFVISATRLSVRNIPFAMTEAQLRALAVRAVKSHASKEKPEVLQVKILRDEERLDKEGRPRSKGMGFIEFSKHDHAIACLRELNNNPTAFTNERRPILEFAIDNVKVLKKLEAIRSRAQQQQQQQALKKAGGKGEEGGEERPAKRARTGNEEGGSEGGEDEEGGEDASMANLTPRQRKKLKAKAKMQRRKERKKQQQQQQQGSGAGEAAADGAGQDKAAAVPAGEGAAAAGGQQKGKGQQAGKQAQKGRQGGKQQQAAGGKQQGQRQQRDNQQQQHDQGVMQRKRAADDELDRLAEEALNKPGAGADRKRRRRGADETDRLDMLAENYKRKLEGKAAGPGARAAGKAAAGKQGAGQGKGVQGQQKQQRQQGGKQQQQGGKSPQQQGGKGKQGGAGQAPAGKAAAAPVKLDLAGGSLKRWFD